MREKKVKCELCNERLRKFSDKLMKETDLVEKTMLRCANPIRYLELKAIIKANKKIINDLDEELQIFK